MDQDPAFLSNIKERSKIHNVQQASYLIIETWMITEISIDSFKNLSYMNWVIAREGSRNNVSVHRNGLDMTLGQSQLAKKLVTPTHDSRCTKSNYRQ